VPGQHLAWIQEVLEHNKKEPRKQRHTAKRIFDRLKAERGYTGGYTVFLVPVPKVSSLAELNEMLDERCPADLRRQLWGKSGTKEVLLTAEHAAFLPLPAQAFEAGRVTQADASSLSLVQFDTNRYSVPVKYATSLGIAAADTIEGRPLPAGQDARRIRLQPAAVDQQAPRARTGKRAVHR
jgi:hypothetical protein